MTLEQFEDLVLSQKPAEVPWEPVTDYSFEARKAIEGPHPQLIKDVFDPTRAFDVGCGPGHLVRMLRSLGIDCDGFDKDANSLLKHRHCHKGDITSFGGYQMLLRWDGPRELVICREVLEHMTLRQIRKAVTNLCALSSRYVYVTTRFHPNPASLFDVATSDGLDPTHISMLNQDFLRVLFVLEGFKRRADLEERLDWQQKHRVLVYERAH